MTDTQSTSAKLIAAENRLVEYAEFIAWVAGFGLCPVGREVPPMAEVVRRAREVLR